MNALARRVSSGPVVSRADAILAHVEVLRIIDVFVGASLDAVDHLSGSQCMLIMSSATELTLGSRSSNIARGMYLVSSDYDTVIPNPAIVVTKQSTW